MSISRRPSIAALGCVLSIVVAAPASAVDINDTRMLADPAMSADHIAFAYADDLWVANTDGSGVRRLTSHPGVEARPRFSADGSMIAFSGSYDGNVDVYLVPVEGGVPTRLTWHPGADLVQGFTPDGAAVLFTSGRDQTMSHPMMSMHTRLFAVPLAGGLPDVIDLPMVFEATYSPDGRYIAYVPMAEAFRQWKNYRGGRTSRIWLYDPTDHGVEQIPQPAERCNDIDPMWIVDTIYFVSDRAGEFNLFAYNTATGNIEQLTDHQDFPILNASAGGGSIIYEQAGYLHVFNPAALTPVKLTVGVAADLIETRPRFVSGNTYIRSATLSPSGARAVFEFRGEVITVPAEKGDPRNLTLTPGVHERTPMWSPDGSKIAYLSDASGEYQLHIAAQDGKGDVEIHPLEGAGFYSELQWSPDGTMISYVDNSRSLYWFDFETGKITKVATDEVYYPNGGPFNAMAHDWSPDSRWLVYAQLTETNFRRIFVHSLESGESIPVTDGLSDATNPVFDAGGQYVYFAASTEAGPVIDWFSQAGADMEMKGSLYLAVLPKGVMSPLAKESDEEVVADAEETADEDDKQAAEEDDAPKVVVDAEGLDQRILPMPVQPAFYTGLKAGAAGSLFYLKDPNGAGASPAQTSVCTFNLGKREETTLVVNASRFELNPDGSKVLYQSGEAVFIAGTEAPATPGEGKLATDSIQVRIDPRAEWPQIFNEAWRINRDEFYDPGMHGADWDAMLSKYAALLPDLTTRNDLNTLIQWMGSELAVGHHFVGGGDSLTDPEPVPGGLLGADIGIDNGRYRFTRVLGGLNWNPQLRSPLTEPGVDVVEGEYLLEVNGVELRPPTNPYAPFENTAGKIVEITVGPNADGSGSRTVDVVPVESEGTLRNLAWVEGNIRRVDEATGGRVAYVHVPDTSTFGHAAFKRYFFPQTSKDAVIIDDRHNMGGSIADYYIDILRRPYLSHWALRYGKPITTPHAAIFGPKVMLIDETSSSGGDMLPWMFHKLQIGPLVGRRTWGGLVGNLGFPVLMDGGTVSAPNLAIWVEEGFVVENVGVPPDIEVEMLPADVIGGRDPQLEKAIEVILEMLEADPPEEPKMPPYPIRVRR
jgi:tricorn protease